MGGGEVKHQVRLDVFFLRGKWGPLRRFPAEEGRVPCWGFIRLGCGRTGWRENGGSWEGSRTWIQGLKNPKGEEAETAVLGPREKGTL